MLTSSARFAATMTTSRLAALRVDSWRGGALLAADLQVESATWEVDGTNNVPERVTLTVPATPEYLPTGMQSPLSDKGQRLRISRGVVLPDTGETEYLTLGWVRIQSYEVAGGSVTVEAVGLAAILDDARLLDPVQTSGSYAGTAQTLVGGLLPMVSNVTDRSSSSKSWQDNRLDALYELADTWPAVCAVDANGTLVFSPAANDATDPVVANFIGGQGGTLVSVNRSSERDGVYNAVKAMGEQSGDVPPVSAVVFDLDPNSPTNWNGPYGQVPMFYASPLLSTYDSCVAAATTRLGNVKSNALGFVVQAAIDPRLQARDVIRVTSPEVAGVGRVDSIAFDLMPGGSGVMEMQCHLLGGRS